MQAKGTFICSLLTISLIIPFSSSQAPITLKTRTCCTNAYFLSIIFNNINVTKCTVPDSISTISIFENNVWRASSTNYNLNGERVHDWNFNQVTYDTLLPIDIRITMTSGIIIDLPDIITTLNSTAPFVSAKSICGGTLAPSRATSLSPSISPTKSPVIGSDGEGNNNDILYDEDGAAKENEDALPWTAWFAIGVSIFGVIACIIGVLLFCHCERKRKEKYGVSRVNTESHIKRKASGAQQYRDDVQDDYWSQRKKELDREARKSLGMPKDFKPDQGV